MKFKSEVQLEALNNATVDTDKFLVSDSSTVKYRTGAQVLSDIGGQAALTNPITGTGTLNYVSKFTSATSLGNSQIFDNGTNVGIGTASPGAKLQIDTDTNAANGLGVRNINIGTSAYGFVGVYTSAGGIDLRAHSAAHSSFPSTSMINSSSAMTNGLVLLQAGANPIAFWTNGSERMRITSAGNVGIGTTSPSALLSLQTANNYAAIFNTSTIPSSNTAIGIGGYGTGLGTSGGTIRVYHNHGSTAATQMAFEVNGNYEAMRIMDTGDVGIGTTDPSYKLDVNGVINTNALFRIGDATTIGGIGSANAIFGVGGNDWVFYNPNATSNVFYTSGTERIRITSTGNVGIGMSSPSEKLHISGNTLVTGTLEVDTVNNGVGDFLTRTAGGIVTRRTAAEVRSDIGAQAALTNPVTGTGTLNFVSKFTSTGSTLGNSQIFDDGSSVGIGTSGPLNKVDIVSLNNDSFGAITVRPSNQTQTMSLGWQGVSASLNFIVNTAAAERMRITSAGNVGIGTTVPDTLLHISSLNSSILRLESTNTALGLDAVVGEIQFEANDASGSGTGVKAKIGAYSDVAAGNAVGLRFFTGDAGFTTGTEKMRILANGNVNIGTASGGTRLYVDYTTNGPDGIVSRNLSTGTSAFGYVGAFNNLTNGIDLRSYSSTHASLPSTSVIQSSSGQTGGTIITQSGINPIRFNTNGGERMRISGGGEVGIGTTAPSFPLSFGTGLGNKIALYDASSGTGYGFGVQASLLQMFSNAVGDDITFGYGNSASMVRNVTFKGTGNVGIGTTAPVDKLDVNGSIRFRLNTPNFTGAIDSGVLDFVPTSIFPTDPQIRLAAIGTATVGSSICFLTGLSTTVAERMRITTAGNVGIGISNPVAKLDVFSSGTVQTAVLGRGLDGNFRLVTAQDVSTNADQSVIGLIGLDYITTPNAAVRFHRGGSTTGGFISFTTNDGSERMRITSAGAMGLGVTPTNTAGRFEASNDIVAYSSSDRRWKTNIKNIDSPLEKISQINGVEFDWIEDEPVHGNKGHDIGVIAQEIENILPDAVQTRESGMKAVKYEKVIPLLIEAIKEQQKQIEELKQLLNGITN